MLAAVGLASRGFRVFPLPAGRKSPPIEDFPRRATADPKLAAPMWFDAVGNAEDSNIGIATGGELMVLDFDMKPGQRGSVSLNELRKQGLPDTLTVRTPTGGAHLYFAVPGPVANSVGKIAPNVDVRGERGYVVAPGSVTPDGVYLIEEDRPLADAPPWLVERCGRPRERLEDATPLVDLDEPSAVARAIEYLREAPRSIKGANGDITAYRVAAAVKDFGISETMCLELMLSEAWDDGCGWAPERLETKVANAYSYGRDPAGIASAAAEFPAVEPAESAPPAVPGLGWDDPADLWAETAPPPGLPTGLLPVPFETWIRDEAERLGVEPAVIAGPALVGMAALIPSGIQVQVKQNNTSYTERPILWSALVGKPGAKKTPAINVALQPVFRVERTAVGRYLRDLAAFEAGARARKAAKQDPDDGARPVAPALVVRDATTEATAQILATHPHGLLSVQDELVGWIGGMDAYRSGNAAASKDRAFWLEAKNGNPHRVDRVSRDPVLIPSLAVRLIGGIQPDKLAPLAKNLTSDGLLPRFLIVVCPDPRRSVDRAPNAEAAEMIAMAAEFLAEVPVSEFTTPFRFALDATQEREAVEAFMESRAGAADDCPGLAGWLSKLEGEWARIALVLHLAEWAAGIPARLGASPPELISADTARRARLLLTDFFYPHQVALYRGLMGFRSAATDAQWIAGYILSRGSCDLRGREVKRAYPGLRGDNQRLAAAMDELETLGWVRPTGPLSDRGRRWSVNPEVHERFADRAEAERAHRLAVRAAIGAAA